MSKKLIQFRYFGDGTEFEDLNYPKSLEKSSLQTGEIFYDYMPIAQLGIQSVPGLKFYLNDSTEPIIVGSSGIYDLMANGTLKITKLQFDISGLNRIEKERNNYLIIDILYGEEE